MTERQVNFKITADTSDLNDGLEKAKKKTEEVGQGADEVTKKTSRWGDAFKGFKTAGGSGGPFEGMKKSIGDVTSKLKGAGTMGKVALGGAVAAVAMIAVKAIADVAKKVYDFSKEMAKVADPVAVEESQARLNRSLDRTKSALGNVLKPIFEGINWIVGGIADGLTTVLEGLLTGVGYLQGLLGLGHSVNKTLNDDAQAMEDLADSAAEGLASFDKLTTMGDVNVSGLEESQKIEDIMARAREDGAALRADIGRAFKIDFRGLWEGFKNSARNAWQSVAQFGTDVWNGLKGVISGVWQSVADIGAGVWDGLKGVMFGVVEAVQGAFTALFDAVWGVIEKLVDAVNGILEPIKGMTGAAGDVLGGAWNNIKGLFGAANGAVIAPNDPHAVIVGDNRREQEIISPLSTIEAAVSNALAKAGTGSGEEHITIEVPIRLDGRQIARGTYDYLKQESRRRGTTL